MEGQENSRIADVICFTADEGIARIVEVIGGHPLGLVISDVAPI
ncbi:hypothetical protein PSEUDO8AS_100210 [Pseudomonas sp. 8AS]|nr:hypothetical protein PSEUDO8AS_100210 [Pseudomonas sp. 8AS]